MDCAIQSRNWEKFALSLTAEGDIDSRIQGQSRIVCAYEIIRQQLGQASSRYPRSRVPHAKMDDALLHREGLFYSALAQSSFATLKWPRT